MSRTNNSVPSLARVPGGIEGRAAENLHDPEKKEAEKPFAEAREVATEYGDSVETATEVGQPEEVIVEYAERGNVDHIIVGSHGRSGLSGTLVGGVAGSVVRESPVAVTTARE